MPSKLYYTQAQSVEIPFKKSVFPGGEIFVRLSDDVMFVIDNHSTWSNGVTIESTLRNSEDVMELIMLTDAIRRAAYNPNYPINLRMAYVPYARQDRVCVKGESLSIAVFAGIINSLKFNSVTVCDPHSTVTEALFDNIRVTKQSYVWTLCLSIVKNLVKEDYANMCLVAPDTGALKKVYDIKDDEFHPVIYPIVCLNKRRDLVTTNILGTEIISGDPKDRVCFIVDDICDGGRTFIESAKVLRAAGAKKVYLFVTHGIFSAGLETLKQHLDGIVTTNSFCSIEPDNEFLFVRKLYSI